MASAGFPQVWHSTAHAPSFLPPSHGISSNQRVAAGLEACPGVLEHLRRVRTVGPTRLTMVLRGMSDGEDGVGGPASRSRKGTE